MTAKPDGFGMMGAALPLGVEPADVRKRVEVVERILERSIRIPGLERQVGLDAIIGLVPVAGDVIAAGMGMYLVWEARNLGMSKWHRTRMLANIGVDTVIGAIPFAGDLFDFLFRSNSKNLRIIINYLDKHFPHTQIIDG